MYEQYYGLQAKPFQQRPDPSFFFGSKGHKRAAAYLDYGLSQGEGFIVITGEVGAGKTTLIRQLFRNLPDDRIVAAQIANTHLDAADTVHMVAAAFGLVSEQLGSASKASILNKINNFLEECDASGKRALLVVDEAQNLELETLEELRMLSNFHVRDKPVLQTFLLGQPEFRDMLASDDMLQLRQRVIASCHLGPMDQHETRDYILHRLSLVGWRGDPTFDEAIFVQIHDFTNGIPRQINTLCDRLLLLGYLEEVHILGRAEVDEVIRDLQQEFAHDKASVTPSKSRSSANVDLQQLEQYAANVDRSLQTILEIFKRVLAFPRIQAWLKQEDKK